MQVKKDYYQILELSPGASLEDIKAALENFTKAIELQPDFERAYLKRCETLYKLGDDREVLRDCEELLKLDNNCAEAYYRGRSRYRLGYAASAVEAYTEAIKISNNYALAYYYRGLAYNELKESSKAIEALQTAAKLFQQQNDSSGYKLARDTLKNLSISSRILSSITVFFR